MKCYYDQQIFMLQGNGGVSRYFFELIRRVGETPGVQPTLFAGFSGTQLPLDNLSGARVLRLQRFKVGPLWPFATRLCDAANRRLVRALAPDVYHPTYYRPAPKGARTRLVVTVYDMIHEKFPHLYLGDETATLKRAACEAADAVICISESARRDLLGYHPGLESKTSVIYLAAAPEFTAAGAGRVEPETGPPYALFVGSRRDYKGFDLALAAWGDLASSCPELRLVCVGGGAFNAAEFAEIRRLGLTEKITQRAAGDAELSALYRRATMLVYPSRYEGFGLPVLEAMGCGCPVICSRSSSLPEVGGEAAVYFEPGDAEGLASRVTEIAGDPARRAELARAGPAQNRRFSWDECARQTVEVYRSCSAKA